MLIPVLLAGGTGSRLWPVSRGMYPKQLQRLTGELTMLQESLDRVQGFDDTTSPLVICNDEHRFMVAEQLRDMSREDVRIVLESVGRNTAPAVAAAALLAADPDAVLLVMAADHDIQNRDAFSHAVSVGRERALAGQLVTFGITPGKPHTGYGYVRKAAGDDQNDSSSDWFPVAEFVEKPDMATAERYVASGEYFWNSGIFMFKASTFLAELKAAAPEIVQAVTQAVADSREDLDFLRLSDAFAQSPSDSIDYAVMEKTSNAVVIPVDMGWSDIGSWKGLWEVLERDADGNAIQGDVIAENVQGSYLKSEGRLIAAVNVKDIVVVETADAVLVADMDGSEDVKLVVEKLKAAEGDLDKLHKKVYRPWGSFEGLGIDERFQVKRLTLKPGAKISLQRHNHRSEHWVVVSGVATVVRGDKTLTLTENESTFIPVQTVHQLENRGDVPLEVVEVQTGSYFGEDDIERFEDIYGRIEEAS